MALIADSSIASTVQPDQADEQHLSEEARQRLAEIESLWSRWIPRLRQYELSLRLE
jgi:hypothetical protein